jgi:lambda family phage portal protein
MYASARPSRLRGAWGASSTSANAELQSSLKALRDRSRQLVRDSAYAKRARQIVVDNVIGTGVGMQAGVRSSRDELRKDVNKAIGDTFWKWCDADTCHTGGQLHFCDFERQVIGQVFEAGEVLIRLHYRRFGESSIPLSLELIEPEQLADDWRHVSAPSPETRVIMGVEVDRFYRPVAYWIRDSHPGETLSLPNQTAMYERVPAEQIIHLRIIDRWPQIRGVPWLHSVIAKLADIDGYTEAEIVAARAASMYFGTIETTEETSALGEEQADGTYELPLQPGMVEKLAPGEKLNFVNPNRPNAALDPFLRYMLREMASGTGVSYESLSRDYSQSNYSSSRLALLEDRDAWRAIQQWFIRNFRDRLHRVWMHQAVLSGALPAVSVAEYALNPAKFEAVSFKPRGWSWVDPTKEVEAYKEAVKAGFTTVADVIAQTDPQGRDMDEVLEQRRRELDEMDELDLEFDTNPDAYMPPEPAAPVAAAPPPGTAATGGDPAASDSADAEDPAARHINVAVHLPEIRIENHVPPSQVHVKAPIDARSTHHTDGAVVNVAAPTVENRIDIPATVVNVAATEVRVEPPQVTVEAPSVTVQNQVDVPAPIVNVENRAPEIRPEVTVHNTLPAYEVTEQRVQRDEAGRIEGTITKRHRKG